MKEQSEGDRGIRKSNRQRVPNAFYTEGINQLKRAPRPARDPPKPSRKRSIVYQEEMESEPEAIEEERSDGPALKDGLDWLPCKLPKNGTMIKVQFVVQQPQEQIPQKKPQPAKPVKKADTTFDLLSLFQKAIENVYEQGPAQKSAEIEPQPPTKEPKMRKEASIPKPRRVQDQQGRITSVDIKGDVMTINHSKIGTAEFLLQTAIEEEEETPSREEVEEYRRKIQGSGLLGQISIFN